MAKLPPIDVQVHWIRDLLHRGRRDEALKKLEQVLSSGKAGRETVELAEYLRTAGPGRQPFGAKHLWWDIGVDNDDLRIAGVSYADRLQTLSLRYRLGDTTKVATAIAKYEAALEASHEWR